jgi:hypothetical protein
MDPWVIQPLSERYLSDKPGRQKSTLLPKSYGVSPAPYPTDDTLIVGVAYTVGAGVSM